MGGRITVRSHWFEWELDQIQMALSKFICGLELVSNPMDPFIPILEPNQAIFLFDI